MKKFSFISNCIRKSLLAVGLSLIMPVVAVFSSVAADSGMKTLHGHVPAIVSQSRDTGRLPATTTLNLAIGLPLRNREALTNLLQQVYDPSSPNYHHYLSPEQFTEKFGPTKEEYQEVVNFAQVSGLTVTGTHPNRMLLDVSGKASNIQKAFHVILKKYRHPTENRDFFAPDTEPTVNSSLPILDVSGLDNYWTSRPKLKLIKMPAKAASKNGSGAFGSYLGNDFRNAYVPGSTLNGAGQTVGLFEEDGYFSGDITTYEGLAGRTNVLLQNVLIDGVSGVPGYSGFPNANEEVALDIEMAVAIAPALSKIIVYEGPIFTGQNDILNRMTTDNAAKQLSCSWGWMGGPSATTDQIFQQMALQGQSFFNASGDNDAFTPGTNSINGVDNPNIFNAPSDSPYITQVGGTTLTMNGTGNSYSSEVVWNWGTEFGIDGFGSSGGISSYYPIPSWQTNINANVSKGSSTFRNTPDVAMVADNILIVADGGFEEFVGGTSAAAPLWAGFIALANQQATNNGHALIGFLNPSIYNIASDSNYTNCFHDITTGNNEWSGSPTLFIATNNYDLCTGLGTPNGTNLINALVNSSVASTITHLSPPPAPYGSTLSSLNGGNPNGAWQLFVVDSAAENDGIISNGWILTLTSANPVGTTADLVLSMTASTTNLLVGGDVIYTIGVTNYGPSTSSNAVVVDTLPSDFTLVATNSTQGSVSRAGSMVTWNVGNILTNAGAQLTLTSQANAAGVNLINSASASADTSDPYTDDNSAFAYVNVGVVVPPQLSGGVFGANGIFQLSIGGSSVPTIIQASTNLASGNWLNIYTSTPPFIFTNFDSTNYPTRFYRAVTAQ
jgi:uncharacterized repeat protein (TIGR01451 family)